MLIRRKHKPSDIRSVLYDVYTDKKYITSYLDCSIQINIFGMWLTYKKYKIEIYE